MDTTGIRCSVCESQDKQSALLVVTGVELMFGIASAKTELATPNHKPEEIYCYNCLNQALEEATEGDFTKLCQVAGTLSDSQVIVTNRPDELMQKRVMCVGRESRDLSVMIVDDLGAYDVQ